MEDKPPEYVSPPETWKSKTALRAASLVFLVVIAGIGGSLSTMPRLDIAWLILIMVVPGLAVTFIWDIAEVLCILKRGGNRGIHPGAVVAIDLILWLGWLTVGFMLGVLGLMSHAGSYILDYSGSSYTQYGTRYNYNPSKATPEDAALEREVLGKGRALVAFVGLTVIVHFVLFVIACRETHTRNSMPRTIYVMQPVSVIPAGYQQLEFVLPKQMQNQVFMQMPPGQPPIQPAAAVPRH
ncbi:hypothetical protein N657DRAFT_677529 [Parathielavia appendiculata]|uniref:Uncharacterized protein n=1 Tax=Parathielavia appendiculata TaxID=2587402 RepID=A0AAN6U5F4_9PEZI|nr:hypothetical protein N657DRAFT_677529 [Parathielavia appendiculata]